jgi:hypothetical protein
MTTKSEDQVKLDAQAKQTAQADQAAEEQQKIQAKQAAVVQEKYMKENPDFIRMEKNGETVAVNPASVESKKGAGWSVTGMVLVDKDGKAVEETAKVIETPAHVFLTSDGYLKVIPDNFNHLVDPKA